MTAMRIEKTEAVDLDRIAAIEAECFSDPRSIHSLEESLYNPLVLFISAFDEDADEPIGYAILQILDDEAELLSVAVSGGFRRRGAGRAMLQRIIGIARNEGVKNMYLEVRESNLCARRLYESEGFVPVGKRRGYYKKPTEDALVMRAVLTAPIP